MWLSYESNKSVRYDTLCSSFLICSFSSDIIFSLLYSLIYLRAHFFLVFVFTWTLESAFLFYGISYTKRIVQVELNKYRNHMWNTNKVIGVPLEGWFRSAKQRETRNNFKSKKRNKQKRIQQSWTWIRFGGVHDDLWLLVTRYVPRKCRLS